MPTPDDFDTPAPSRAPSDDDSAWPDILSTRTLREGDAVAPRVHALQQARDLLFEEHVGAYQLGPRLGQGGMGEVYLARQEQPLRRDVALKVIKRGMDTESIVRRFASERKALALMDHPAIARVLDAGATADGRPFVAMELVRGGRITDVCDARRLGVHERLRLFLEVLRGVQHAHQKGVLHRDLKPSNILVAVVDGQLQPKIIDFGIARAVNDDEPLASQATVVGQFIGTPEYMSPEQAGAIGGGVDARSDVYSLGVVLYELLTGHRPYDFARRTPTAVSARLTERSRPLRPSAAVHTRTLAAAPESTIVDRAAARAVSPARLRRLLRGDLDTIVLKAIHPDPERRYGSAEQFSADLERFLEGRPVLARPDSLPYRTQRFVQRHVFGVAVTALAAVGGLVFVVLLARERTRALEAEQQARIEAGTATAVSDFLVSLFDVASPETGKDRGITAREMVDRGVARIRSELTDEPAVRGQLLFTLGSVYRELGRIDQAEPLLREALDVRRQAFGASHPLVADTLGRLARIRLDRGDTAESLALYEQALEIRRAVSGPASAPVGEVLNNIGLVHLTAGRFAEASAVLAEAAEIRLAAGGEGSHGAGSVLYNMAVTHYELGQYDDALTHLDRAEPLLRAELRAIDDPHPKLVALASFRGLLLRELDRQDEALEVLERGVEAAREIYTEPNPALATILTNLALVVQRRGDLDRAEGLYREVLAIDQAVYGERHADVAHDYFNLGTFLYRHRGHRDEGTRYVQVALDMRRDLLGADHPATAVAMRTLADYHVDAGRVRDALPLLEAAHAAQVKALPPDHPSLATTRQALDAARHRLK